MSANSKSRLETKHHSEWLLVFLAMAPLCLVTVRSWVNAILILGALFCSIDLIIKNREKLNLIPQNNSNQLYSRILLFIFSTPIISVATSSILRGDQNIADYDSASRFLLAIPIFIWMQRHNQDAMRVLQISIPFGLIFTLLNQWLIIQPHHWGINRMATYFADPLVFGYTSLTLGLISFASIKSSKIDGAILFILKIIGGICGIYLSIKSESRTGWLMIPITFWAWIYYKYNRNESSKNSFRLFLIASVLIFGIFLSNETVQQRLSQAFQNIENYSFSGIAPETSVGYRITFLRIAYDMFLNNPYMGYGDTRQYAQALPTEVNAYASSEAIRLALNAGFHNEIVTQAVRNGLFGLLSSLSLFLVPAWILSKKIKLSSISLKYNASSGLIFVFGFMVSSFSTEVFDLKYTASFYALMVALFCGSTLSNRYDTELRYD